MAIIQKKVQYCDNTVNFIILDPKNIGIGTKIKFLPLLLAEI